MEQFQFNQQFQTIWNAARETCVFYSDPESWTNESRLYFLQRNTEWILICAQLDSEKSNA